LSQTVVFAQNQNIPSKDEILWRAVLTSNPSNVVFARIVATRAEPFAGWAFEEIIQGTENDIDKRVATMATLLTTGATPDRYRERAVGIILLHKDRADVHVLGQAIDFAPYLSVRDQLVDEMLSRSDIDYLVLDNTLSRDVSQEYKEKVARRLLERDFSGFSGDHLLTLTLFAIIREVREPYKRLAFEQLWNKPWDSIVSPIRFLEVGSVADLSEPYRSILEAMLALPLPHPNLSEQDINNILPER